MRLHVSRHGLAITAACLIAALYLADVDGMGMYGPDEPRYSAVGRAMAQTGDWVTPRLWGKPWFEKPVLLYWMTAIGFRAGFDADLAPRVPVALMSLAFLAFFWARMRSEWGSRAASHAAAILATSAGWLAYSHVAVTDIPVAVLFSAALFLSLPWIGRGDRNQLPAAAALLGLATLAKGLVPLVLFLPVLVFGWRKIGDWMRPSPLLAFSACALPWYVLCTIRNGWDFLRILILEQHFGRFFSPVLQHVQPWWFYLPALLLLLFPWSPLLLYPRAWLPAQIRSDSRVRMLVAVVLFGFVFFSVSINKLPGYLIPLLPAGAAVMGVGLSRARGVMWTIAPAMMLGALPPASRVVPDVLAHGLRGAHFPLQPIVIWMLAAGCLAALLAWIAPGYIFAITAGFAAVGFLWFQFAAFPALDAAASARPLWLSRHPTCAPKAPRNILYGLYYYADGQIPDCSVIDQNTIRSVR